MKDVFFSSSFLLLRGNIWYGTYLNVLTNISPGSQNQRRLFFIGFVTQNLILVPNGIYG